ncbi:DUF2341 domain-containing protein, partial [bacterium]|nr:DUF2341 domain-containing protein [bacterium]
MSAWRHKAYVYFDNSGQASNLTDFPVLVVLGEGFLDYNEFEDDGSDLRFCDSDGTLLKHEIEQWNRYSKSYVWVRVPQIDASSDSDYMVMYWGNPSPGSPPTATDAWTSAFSAVWHLDDANDATANANDGATTGGLGAVQGLIGDSMEFDGSDDWIIVPDDSSLDLGTGDFTVSGWIRKDVRTSLIVMAKNFGYQSNEWSWGFGADKIGFRAEDNYFYSASASLTSGTWHHVAFKRSGNSGYSFVDGVQSGSTHDLSGLGALDNTEDLLIGRRDWTLYLFDGMIDELRIEKSARSDDWIKVCHLNQQEDSTFLSYESGGAPAWAEGESTTQVRVGFSERVDPDSATLETNYAISGNTITAAYITGKGDQIVLTLGSALNLDASNTVSVSDVEDVYGFDMDSANLTIVKGPVDWSYSRRIFIDNQDRDENLTSFPLLVVLNSENFDYGQCEGDGSDLRFRDPDTGPPNRDLSYEIEEWNTSGTSCIWVQVPCIDGNVGSDYIELFWGKSGGWTPPSSTGVWSDDFGGVWHMGDANDATVNANNGASTGDVYATTGQIGDGLAFDGSGDYVTVSDDDSLDLGTGPFTVSAWIKKSDLGIRIVAAKSNGYLDNMWSWGWGNDDISFRRGYTNYYYSEDGSLSQDTWHHVAFAMDGTYGTPYVDGEVSSGTYNLTGMQSLTNTEDLLIGRRSLDTYHIYNGMVDELRIEKAARSTDWMNAVYENQSDTASFLEFENINEAWLFLEAEDFQIYGGWQNVNVEGRCFLRIYGIPDEPPPVGFAQTVISVAQTGVYRIWVECRDYPLLLQGSRRLRAQVDGQPLGEVGDHAVTPDSPDWAWQLSGEVALDEGWHLIDLVHTASYARCDAVLLTTSSDDPNSKSRSWLDDFTISPVNIEMEIPDTFDQIAPESLGSSEASLDNGDVKITFHPYTDAGGLDRVARLTQVKVDGNWVDTTGGTTTESLFLIYSKHVDLKFHHYPIWDNDRYIDVEVSGQTHALHGEENNPFLAGDSYSLIPIDVTQINSSTVKVDYLTTGATNVAGYWTLASGSYDVLCSFTLTAEWEGYYSVGMLASNEWDIAEVEAVELPPLFQHRRVQDRPWVVISELTPQPLALVQTAMPGQTGKSLSTAVLAEPTQLEFRWATARKTAYGFCLRNARGKVQPVVFSPLLGCEGSFQNPDATFTTCWRVVTYPGRWAESLEYASEDVMGVTDYRKPVYGSLTDAALNMFDLIMDSEHGGWSADMKGFWDIETKSLTKHASPLTVLSAALLSMDEDFWTTRSLPTLEYTLSRPSAWFQRPEYSDDRLGVPNTFYASSYWLGVERLTGGKNPWLEEFALPGGGPYTQNGMGSAPAWVENLEVWRAHPDPGLLAEIQTDADAWLDSTLYSQDTTPVDFNRFYNVFFYPFWWDLQNLYDITGDSDYLDAAQEGAFHTITGLWSHPMHPAGNVTIHKGGEVKPVAQIWWKDDDKFRLGYYPVNTASVQEKQIPAWQVSRVGLGLEQPISYFQVYWMDDDTFAHITNLGWSAYLLRLAGETDRDIFQTYARNCAIGRFANYPGYYLQDFTDLVLYPDYPIDGPDVSSLYYHHIPVHLGWTLDYLFAQAEQRSGGRVKFPFSKQKNYVWFSSQIYGREGGEVYGEGDAIPWLERGLVTVDTASVDWIAARSEDRFFVTLMSQCDTSTDVLVTFDTSKIDLVTHGTYRRYEGDSPSYSESSGVPSSITLAAKTCVTYSIPANDLTLFPDRPDLDAGHYMRNDLPGTWEELHAFRIRSPFGNDSLYVCLTGGPESGATVTMDLTGSSTQQDTDYPY